MNKLFGTDGIRAVANTDLSCELAMNVGRAVGIVLSESLNKSIKVLIGKDTRISSDMIEGALIAGLCSVGANVILLDVVPTPAVAYLTINYGADAGIMISASHNTFEFNGIKIFSKDGYKLPDELEEKVESIIFSNDMNVFIKSGKNVGRVFKAQRAAEDYVEHVKNTVPYSLDGMKIAIDCSNGSASITAQRLFEGLGAECFMLFDKPNGVNINDHCGSTHIESLVKYVKENNLDAGIAFDGDADRCLAVDENGELLDGDCIMAICAADLKSRGKLLKETVVGTVMTNMGFNQFCSDIGLNFVPTKVGDRYVLENMIKEGYNLGGEQSGHVIFLDFATTGDGELTAAQLLSLTKRRKAKLSSIATLMQKYPQVIINVRVSKEGKSRFADDVLIREKIEEAKNQLKKKGRILVRLSGTEPLVRVMLEGQDQQQIERLATQVADLIQQRLS